MNKIKIPKGWRRLRKGTLILEGDQYAYGPVTPTKESGFIGFCPTVNGGGLYRVGVRYGHGTHHTNIYIRKIK